MLSYRLDTVNENYWTLNHFPMRENIIRTKPYRNQVNE